MRISQQHRDIFMGHQFLHRWEVHSSHHQTARQGVPQVIEREIFKPALRTASSHAEQKELLGSTFVAAEDQTICQRIHSNCLQRCRQHVVHGQQQFSLWTNAAHRATARLVTVLP